MTLTRMPVVGEELFYMPSILGEEFPNLAAELSQCCVVIDMSDRWMFVKMAAGCLERFHTPKLADIRSGRWATLSHRDATDDLGDSPPPFRRRLTPAKPPVTIHGRRCEVCGKHTHEVAFLDTDRLVVETWPGGIRFYVPHDTAMGHRKCLEALPLPEAAA